MGILYTTSPRAANYLVTAFSLRPAARLTRRDILGVTAEGMNFPKALALLGCGLTLAGVLYAFQRPFRQFNGIEHRIGETPLPDDYQEKTEWAFARLMYPPGEGGINGYYGRDLDWHIGYS